MSYKSLIFVSIVTVVFNYENKVFYDALFGSPSFLTDRIKCSL
jgi:hypothetical protein